MPAVNEGFAVQPADAGAVAAATAVPTVVVSEVLLARRERDRERARLEERAAQRSATLNAQHSPYGGVAGHGAPTIVSSRLTSAAPSASSGHAHH